MAHANQPILLYETRFFPFLLSFGMENIIVEASAHKKRERENK